MVEQLVEMMASNFADQVGPKEIETDCFSLALRAVRSNGSCDTHSITKVKTRLNKHHSPRILALEHVVKKN